MNELIVTMFLAIFFIGTAIILIKVENSFENEVSGALNSSNVNTPQLKKEIKKKDTNFNGGWLIGLAIFAILLFSTPKTPYSYGYHPDYNKGRVKVNNFLIFSTCSVYWNKYQGWVVTDIGFLGITFKIEPKLK